MQGQDIGEQVETAAPNRAQQTAGAFGRAAGATAASGRAASGRATGPRRRALLAAGLGGLGAVAVAGPAAATRGRAPQGTAVNGPASVGSARRALRFLAAMADAYPAVNGTGPRLAQSYADELGLFSTAFVYDNALAVCAALTSPGGTALARTLGDGLLYAQAHDPAYSDGRLRQAYNVGPYVFYDGVPQPDGFVRPDGTANIGWQFGFLGTAVGDMAWPGIALVQLYTATRDRRYLAGAVDIGTWIVRNTRATTGLGGFSFGVNAANEPVPNRSTEHNIDCVGFFTQLARATRDGVWLRHARHARAFVERMWEPEGGFFYTGSNDGVTVNRDPLPLDPQTWSWLALRDRRYARALDWAASALHTVDAPSQPTSQLPDGVRRIAGVTFSSASLTSTAAYNGITVHPRGVWLEGTAQLATSLRDRGRAGDLAASNVLLANVRLAQSTLGQGQRVGGTALPPRAGVVAASSLIDTGFGFGYFQVQHVGATAWYLMAVEGANPLQRNGLR